MIAIVGCTGEFSRLAGDRHFAFVIIGDQAERGTTSPLAIAAVTQNGHRLRVARDGGA